MKTKLEIGNKSKLNVMFRPSNGKSKKVIKDKYYPAQLYNYCFKRWKAFNSTCKTFIQIRSVPISLDTLVYSIKKSEEGKIVKDFIDRDELRFFSEVTSGITKTKLLSLYEQLYGTNNNSR